jgi:hypothetical protein
MDDTNPLKPFIDSLLAQIVEPLLTLVALAAFILFLWGVVQYIRAGAEGGKDKEEGRNHMIWGVIGLAVIFGAEAIVAMIGDTAHSLLP